ncbi:MAG TPA: GerMN domain-containing protein [Nitrospirota bacterium]|nr:GerMN domain-containing protein [Nitrospirota bacterium]
MPEKTDRRIGNNPLLLGAVIALITVVVGGGIALWLKMHSVPDTVVTRTMEGEPSLMQFARRDEPLTVKLCFPIDGLLACGTAAVKRQPDTQSQVREVLAAFFQDKRAAETAGIKDIKLKSLYVDASGKAYIDLTSPQQKDIRASAWDEHLAVYAMVNTVIQNFEEIKTVQFLRDGKEMQTLAGHMDLSRSFTKRMDLIKQ